MSGQSIHTRLATLSESLKQLQQSISRLSKLASQSPGNVLPTDEGDQRIELGQEIHQTLKEQEEAYELLRQDVEDLADRPAWASSTRTIGTEREREKLDIAARVAKLGEDLKMCAFSIRS